jgi:DNA-binding GntR family transcriptional regulator
VLDAIASRNADEAADLMRSLVTSAQHDIRRERRQTGSRTSS